MNLRTSLGIIIAVFAFILYVQSVHYNFTLDDHPVIDQNKVTVKGFAGIPIILATDYWYGFKDEFRGPVYRPASLIIYAIVWQVSPNSPHLYHYINVLFYAITCYVLFLLLCEIFKKQSRTDGTYSLLFPFVCSLLYATHPIHTEVVNNIKSLDEILCFLFGILSIYLTLKYLSTSSIAYMIFGGISFYISLISKETGITFLVIIPLVIYFFTDNPLKKIGKFSLILIAIAAVWLGLRMLILKDVHQSIGVATSVLNNTLISAPNIISRYATVFYILLRYIILLIIPHPLTCDYNFAQIKIQTLADPAALLGIVVYAGLGVFALINLKNKSIIAFGILYFVITLTPISNIFFLNGATMAERFMFTPSLGFCMILTYFLIKLTKTESIKKGFKSLSQMISMNSLLFTIVFGIIALYSIKTFSRNMDWKDNLTVFSQDVKTSPNSATANKILGTEMVYALRESPNKKNQLDTFNLAKSYLRRSLEIYPDLSEAMTYLGIVYYMENNFDSAYYYQSKAIKAKPEDVDLNYNYGKTLDKLKKYDEAIKVLDHAVALDPKHEGAYFNLALSYTNKEDMDKGLFYFSKVIEINPKRGDANYYSGMLFKAKGDTLKAKKYFGKATALGFTGQ
jgi:tetratricopeptide (TPR) repeat protein